MSTNYESADLLLKLYDLRRESTMREARAWFVRGFHPESTQEILDTVAGPESAKFRMVASYWDMACSLVNHGAIDESMFNEAGGEHVAVFSKIAPYLTDYRATTGLPQYLGNLEQLVMRLPNIEKRLVLLRERFRPKS
jgi:hypothetical protein